MPLINDGTVQYGARVLTINSVTYVDENHQATRPSTIIERRNELNEPSGQVAIADFVTGSASLQLATGATVTPPLGETFTTTFLAAAETFFISQVGQPEEQ